MTDYVWVCEIFLQPSAVIYWRAFEGSGSDLNYIAGIDSDIEFSLSENGVYDSNSTSLEIPNVESDNNNVRFEVDMTEWLDQDGCKWNTNF